MFARSLPSAPGSGSRSTNDPACSTHGCRARGIRHGAGPRAVERLRLAGPPGVVEAGRAPQLGQHDEVVPGLVGDERGHPLDPGPEGLVVVVPELDHRDAHPPILP